MIPVITAMIQAIGEMFVLFGYVSNANSFPLPLEPEEEYRLMMKFKNGDSEAKNVLVERNLRLVAYIAKKYNSTVNDWEDLISIGTIGLMKAISTFDYEKGTRLVTYAATCIENEIRMHIRSTSKIKNEVSLQDPVGIDKDGNETALIDVLENDSRSVDEQVELSIQKKWLYSKMKTVLKNKEKFILELRYGLLNQSIKTQMEIAKMLGISRSYVSRIEKKAIKKLSRELKPENCN